jgi:hypothetical protein
VPIICAAYERETAAWAGTWAPLGCLGIVRLGSERTLPVRDPRSIVDERDWEEATVTDRDVMGGPEPDEQRTDLLGGAEAATDELGGPEPDEQRTDLLGGADPD